MNRRLIIGILCASMFTTQGNAQTIVKKTELKGYLGQRIDQCIEHHMLPQDVDHLIETFQKREETQGRWASEFWGKWVQGAIASYEYTQDPVLKSKIHDAENKLIATQGKDGYIGDYPTEYQLKNWDVWGRKYTLLGLIKWYRVSGDKKALKAACRLLDYTMTQIGPGKRHIYETGIYRGMPPSSILEPVMFLYQETKNENYLNFAKYIVEDDETDGGPQLIAKADGPVNRRFLLKKEDKWGSFGNGQKAYEMMSCYVGMLELYRTTGETRYLDAAKTAYKHILDEEITIVGSGASSECWFGGKKKQTIPVVLPMETCVTFTWMQFNERLLEMTGESHYADELELSIYNALMASMKDDGSAFGMYTPLSGFRRAGVHQCERHMNCCQANAPRAFAMIPQVAYRATKAGEIQVNLYVPSTSEIQIGKQTVKIEQETNYPKTGNVLLKVIPEKEMQACLKLRIPAWSKQTEVEINGKSVSGIRSGEYLALDKTWHPGDQISMKMDMSTQVVKQDEMAAFKRGPIVLARDSRFNDGDVDEGVLLSLESGIPEIKESQPHEGMWMTYEFSARHGVYLTYYWDSDIYPVHLCDFASAGNQWDEKQRYRVWIPSMYDSHNENR